ncbi:MAG: potassium channel protein [Bacteroidetes bacterium]|nr:MAG: potassium channel protein [Bacteroidota bacterium]
MKRNSVKHAYLTLGLLLSVVVIGTIGYSLLGFTTSEAIYQTIITIATVGFEEVHQLDNTGMWFTSFLVVVSIGIFFYAVTSFTRYIVEGVFMNTYKDSKVKRKIEKISDHVVICGYGRNGKQAAIELQEHNVKVVIIENDPEIIQGLRDTADTLYVEGDAADEEALKLTHLESAQAMITTLPQDADNLFVVLSAKELNPHLKIISRASLDNSDVKLKRAGATNVIMPDKIGGQRMAKLVAQPDIVEFIDNLLLQSADNVVLEEISCKDLAACFAGKSIIELDIRNSSGANIIGLKREDKSYLINPLPETTLSSTDQLFALGTKAQIDHLRKTITTDGLK